MKKFLAILIALAVPLLALASVTVTVNGTNHTIPQTNERGWGNAVTAWIQAISANTLQPTGGVFTLSSDVDFGANYGLKTSYLLTRTANPSTSGLLRLAKTDSVGWRNNANSGNLLLGIDSSDNLTFNGNIIATTSTSGFVDSNFFVVDASDATKRMGVNAGGTTGTTSTLSFAQTADRTITFPDATDTLVGRATTDTLTNKTLTSPVINTPTGIVKGDVGLGNVDNTSDATKNSASATLTNKTINGSNNTITNVSLATGVTGTLPIANGGTGQTTANTALNALLPTQTGNSAKFLTTDGSNTSWAQASLSTQGQSEGSSTSTLTLKVPYNQRTTTGTNESLIETGNGNLLVNPSFEASSVSTGILTNVSATVSYAAEATEIIDGKQSLKATLTSVNGQAFYQVVTPTIKTTGRNFEYSIWLNTSMTTGLFCPLIGGTSITAVCQFVIGDSAWHQYVINYPAPPTGSSAGWEFRTSSSTSGIVYADASYVGPARNIGTVAQSYTIGGVKIAGSASPLCQWQTTSGTVADFAADTDCGTPTAYGSATAPGTKIPQVTFASLQAGDYYVDFFTRFDATYTTSSTTCGYVITDGTTSQIYYISDSTSAGGGRSQGLRQKFSYPNGASNVTFKVQGIRVSGGGTCNITASDSTNSNFEIAVQYVPNSSQTAVTPQQQRAPTIQKFTSGTSQTYTKPAGVAYIRVRMVGGGAGGSGSGVSQTAGNAGAASTFGSDLSAGGGQVGSSAGGVGGSASCGTITSCTAIDGGSGSGTGVTLTTAVTALPGGSGGSSYFGGGGAGGSQGSNGGNASGNSGGGGGGAGTDASSGSNLRGGGGGGSGAYVDAIISNPSNTYTYTVGAGGSGGATSTSGHVGGNGAAGYIEVTEYYSQSAPILVGSVTSGTSGAERIERAVINCSSSSLVYTQSGSWISVANISGNRCALTFTGFSNQPSCTADVNTNSTSTIFKSNLQITSSTAGTIGVMGQTSGTTSAQTSSDINIICMGPR